MLNSASELAEGAPCEGILSFSEGECQLMLVIGVDRDCPEPGGDVQCGQDRRAFDFLNFLIQLGHRPSWQWYLLIQLAIVDGGPPFAIQVVGLAISVQSMCCYRAGCPPFPAWSQQFLALAHMTLLESCTGAQMAHLGLSGCAPCVNGRRFLWTLAELRWWQ